MPTLAQRIKAFMNPAMPQKNTANWLASGLFGHTGESYPSGILQDNKYGYAQAYISVMAVRQAVDYYATSALDIPSQIIKNTSDNDDNDNVVARSDDVQTTNELYAVFNYHQHEYGIHALSAMVYNAVLYDSIYAEKINGRVSNGSRHFRVLNSLGVEPRDEMGYISQFDYSWNNEYQMFRPKDIAYSHGFNPFHDLRGASVLASAISKIRIEDNLDEFLQAFFRNNATLGLVGSPIPNPTGLSDLSPEQINTLKKLINDWHTSVRNSFRPFVSNVPINWEVLPQPEIDKQYSIGENIEKEILTAFGVNPALVGYTDSTSYKEDIAQIESQFINKRLRPLLSSIQDLINHNLLPFIMRSNDYRFEFDYTGYQLVTEQDSLALDIRTKQLQSGGLALNDYIEQNGGKRVKGLDDMFIFEGVPVPLVEIPNLWQYKFGQTTAQQAELPDETDTEAETTQDMPDGQDDTPPDTVVDDIDDNTDAGKSVKASTEDNEAFAYIPLTNNPDILRLQRELKKVFTDKRIEWQAAPTLHVTLCYALNLPENAIHRVGESIRAENTIIHFGEDTPIGYFDTPDGKALYLNVYHTTAIDDIQANVYNVFNQYGDGISDYSIPQGWNPHITLAYIPNDIDIDLDMLNKVYSWILGVVIPIDTVVIGRADYDPVVIIKAPEYVKSAPINLDDIFNELVTWKRYIKAGKHEKSAFVPDKTRGYIADNIMACNESASILITALDTEMDTLKAFIRNVEYSYEDKDHHKEWLQQKAIQSTRLDFEFAVETLIESARATTTDKRTFKTRMMQFIRGYGGMAMLDGLRVGGVVTELALLDDDDKAIMEAHFVKQRDYVNNLADVIYGKGISDLEAQAKPSMWFNKSIAPLFEAGKASADGNAMVEWVIGATEESCKDCLKLNGQRHRMKTFYAKGWIPGGSNLECGGWQCKCQLIKVFSSARGRLP